MTTTAAILGCSGPTLTAEEKTFFRRVRPWGFILFKRNVEAPDQVRTLVDALRDTVGRADAPVLIDRRAGGSAWASALGPLCRAATRTSPATTPGRRGVTRRARG